MSLPASYSIAERIRDEMHLFTPTERKAAHMLLANYPVVGLETVAVFAKRAAVSAPTVLRFVARLGFVSYPDFQRALRDELDKQRQSPLMKDQYSESAETLGPYVRFRDALVDNLVESFRHLPLAEFEAISAAFADRRRKVAVIGGRITDALARFLSAHLRVIRPGVIHLDGQFANWRDMLIDFGPKDIFVIFDIRRYQDDLLKLAEAAAARGVTIILFTDQWLSPVARHARHIVSARVAVPSRWDSLSSMLGIVETLVASVTEMSWKDASQRISAIDALKSGSERN